MECGSRRCPPFAFCHEGTNTCKECSDICNPERHSHYEPSQCLEQCRDYMFEQLRSHASDGTARALGAAGLGVSLAALVGLLLLAGALLFCLYRRPGLLLRCLQDKDRAANKVNDKGSVTKGKQCDISRGLDSSVCTVSASISEPELRAHVGMPMAVPQQPCGASTPTPPLTLVAPPPPPARHPSEDSTLDYAAYDNPALSPSSSPLPGGAGHNSTALDAVLDHSALPGSVQPIPNGNAHHLTESSF